MSGSRRARRGTKRAVVVCGPTAGGKSDLSDALAEALSEARGGWVSTLVVDSMQVYEGLAAITNQARRRPAELVGIVPVTEDWTVARHKAAAEGVIGAAGDTGSGDIFVLDAGTGMYLNAILLGVPLSPKVSRETRRLAQELTAAEPNPRRAARTKELELAGAARRRSIWEGDLLYDTTIFYLRPERSELDSNISRRSKKIVEEGLREARAIKEMEEAGTRINPSVMESIGVRELADHLSGGSTLREAEDRVAARTRRLARRQMRWFDKLARTVGDRARIEVGGHFSERDLRSITHTYNA